MRVVRAAGEDRHSRVCGVLACIRGRHVITLHLRQRRAFFWTCIVHMSPHAHRQLASAKLPPQAPGEAHCRGHRFGVEYLYAADFIIATYLVYLEENDLTERMRPQMRSQAGVHTPLCLSHQRTLYADELSASFVDSADYETA